MKRGRPEKKGSRARVIFVLGGASSGKTQAALSLAGTGRGRIRRRLYVATAEARDAEMAEKIRRHRLARPDDWITAEVPVDLVGWLEKDGADAHAIVVDCLTLWLTNLLSAGVTEQAILRRVRELLRAARDTGARVVLVSNELGLGLVPAEPAGRAFRDLAGRVHQLVARDADEVYFVVAGCRVKVK